MDGGGWVDREELSEAIQERARSGARAKLKDHKARALFRRKSEHMAEIAIKRDKHAPLAAANLEQIIVRGAGEILLTHGYGIVPRRAKQLEPTLADVFVELGLHATRPSEIGMICSLATSAP